jgi:cytochrome c oxidase subunit 2
MSKQAGSTHSSADGLWRWLIGGLAGGAIVLGLLVAAYAIGYRSGQDHPRQATSGSPAAPAPTTKATTATTTQSRPSGRVQVTPALIARGKSLFAADGCSACHSLSGTAGAGPSLNGIAGDNVTLDSGQTITADDAYLQQSIANPDAQVVKGYRAGVMPAAIASYELSAKADDIRALVAFIKSQK